LNVLLLSPWLPWPPFDGARIRIFETLRYLSRRHRITLLAAVRHPEEVAQTAALRDVCERIVTVILPHTIHAVLRRLAMGSLRRMPLVQSFHYDPNFARTVRELTSQEAYDIIHIEFPFLTPYLTAVSPQSRAKKILSMHNIESIRLARELRYSERNSRYLVIQWDRLFFASWEQQAIRQFDGITAVSAREAAWIQQHAPAMPVELAPNGVDTAYFAPARVSNPRPSVVFTGLMNHPPNVDAAVWFCQEILPELRRQYPGFCFDIVGRNPHPKVLGLGKRQGVHVTGEVAEIRPYLAAGSALVVPLRSGGGTRLKILEAMAMERPVISTSLGAEGLEVQPGVNILIADEPAQFVRQIRWLIAEPQAADRLGKAGRRLVEDKYDWRMCLYGLERLYDRVLGSPQGRQMAGLPSCEPLVEA
jgi:sugar transferase (PEP-CTERM/EpsH1 system associated)